MCGIAGIFLRETNLDVNLDRVLDVLLDEIDHRGGDATGYAAFGDDGVLEWQKAACDAKDFCKYRRRVPEGTRGIIAHTRWATQGLPAFMENNHPIRRGAMFVVHNGHVLNDTEMFRACNKRAFGDVDSEAIAARLSDLGSLDAAPEMMAEIRGAAAIAAVDERRGDRLTLARGYSSPVFVLETAKVVMFGSTRQAVLNAYRLCIGTISEHKVFEMDEGRVLHYIGRERREDEFKPYKPAATATGDGWVLTTPAKVKTANSDTWVDEDYVDCDDCGVWVPWKDARYTQEEGYTVCRCDTCNAIETWKQGRDPDEDEFDAANEGDYDDFSFIGRRIFNP